ncbi:MAG: cupredoxin domain-containing protein [Chloroflexi bacterium]|nr:cupredoxin domain-containing protein [Chloroflexota bacterium]
MAMVGLMALLTLGCAEGGGDDATPGVDIGGSPAASATNGGGGGGGEAIKIIMKDNLYEPKDIKVKAGQSYTIEVKNEGLAIHNMHVLSKAFGESKDYTSALTVAAGDSNKFEVKFSKKGTVKFQCDYHLPDMAGTITVE